MSDPTIGLLSGQPWPPTAAALGAAALDSPVFTGTPAAPTTASTDSSTRIATTAMVQAALSAATAGLLDLKGSINVGGASTSYPVALKGDTYFIIGGPGKIGGTSGKSVDTGDIIVASVDNAGGLEAAVGTSWFAMEHNLVGAMLTANNGSDIASPAAFWASLGGDAKAQAANAPALGLKASADSPTFTGPATHNGPVNVNEVDTATISTTGSALDYARRSETNLGATVAGVYVAFGTYNRANNYSTVTMSAGTHLVGGFNFFYNSAPGTTLPQGIGGEHTIGNHAGTLAQAISSLCTVNENASGQTIIEWVGSQAIPTNNAGTIGKTVGFRATLPPSQPGTFGAFQGFHVPDLSGVAGVTSRVAFFNEDPGAPFQSKAPFCDASNIVFTPVAGGTSPILKNIGFAVFNGGATIATHTITLPPSTAPVTDGQEIKCFSVYAITTLSVTSAGNTVVGAPTTLAASGYFTMKFVASLSYWIRVA